MQSAKLKIIEGILENQSQLEFTEFTKFPIKRCSQSLLYLLYFCLCKRFKMKAKIQTVIAKYATHVRQTSAVPMTNSRLYVIEPAPCNCTQNFRHKTLYCPAER